MGLLERLFGTEKQQEKNLNQIKGYFKTLTAYTPAFTTWNGALYESELVRASIDAKARHVSKLKVEFVGDSNKKLTDQLKVRPNDWQTWSQFLYRASTILDVCNNCFIVPVEDEKGVTTGYTPILPYRCELVRDAKDNIWIRYKFNNGQTGVIELEKVAVLMKHQYENDFLGDNNNALNETMKLIHLQNEGISEAVKNSATYRFMAQVKNFAKPEDLKKEREKFNEYNLSNDGGGVLLFPNTYGDIRQINSTPYTVDPQQVEQIKNNVFNYFGVNEDILQNKAYGDSWSAFYEGCTEVFSVQFSECMTKAIYTVDEQKKGNEVIATSSRLQYLSNSDKLNVSAQMLDRGIMSINDVRDIWNLPHVEGGDVRVIRGEYYNAERKLNDDEE